jgi:DNA-binding phage protein
MNDKTSVLHDKVMIERLRTNPAFAAEYLKAAIADTEELQVLLIALRQMAEAQGDIARAAKGAQQ